MPLPFFAEVQRFFSTDVYVYVVLVQHWEESAELPRIIPGVQSEALFPKPVPVLSCQLIHWCSVIALTSSLDTAF